MPTSLPGLADLNAIEKLTNENKITALKRTKDSKGQNMLMAPLRILQYGQALPLSYIRDLLEIIAKLPPEIYFDMLQERNRKGFNVFQIAMRYNDGAIKPLLEAASKLPVEKRIQLLQEKYQHGYCPKWTNVDNILLSAAIYAPDTIKPLLADVPPDTLYLILQQEFIKYSYGSRYRYRSLYYALINQPKAIKPLLDAISTLPEEKQVSILQEKNNAGYNALMIAARYQSEPAAIQSLLEAVSTLPEEKQISILQEKNNKGYNALLIATKYQPDAIVPILNYIARFPLTIQASILSDEGDFKQPKFKEYKNALLPKALSMLDVTNPIENRLKTNLSAMKINAASKQLAILDAYFALKTCHENNPSNLNQAIHDALNDQKSPLYCALNIKRYAVFFAKGKESSTLIKMKSIFEPKELGPVAS